MVATEGQPREPGSWEELPGAYRACHEVCRSECWPGSEWVTIQDRLERDMVPKRNPFLSHGFPVGCFQALALFR